MQSYDERLEYLRQLMQVMPSPAELAGQIVDVQPIPSDVFKKMQDSLVYSLRLEAPTGVPPRAWTEQERKDCAEAIRQIVAREKALEAGNPAWGDKDDIGFYPEQIGDVVPLNSDIDSLIPLSIKDDRNDGFYERKPRHLWLDVDAEKIA